MTRRRELELYKAPDRVQPSPAFHRDFQHPGIWGLQTGISQVSPLSPERPGKQGELGMWKSLVVPRAGRPCVQLLEGPGQNLNFPV